MQIHRRQALLTPLALALVGTAVAATASRAETADDAAVSKNVEAFRQAQVAADRMAFDKLCASELSYSHSDGRVEDKTQFIALKVVGDAAIVRFHWLGESEAIADGKKASTNLHILMNWQKQAGDWKLLSRASTKL